jgi:hypothetical protein
MLCAGAMRLYFVNSIGKSGKKPDHTCNSARNLRCQAREKILAKKLKKR